MANVFIPLQTVSSPALLIRNSRLFSSYIVPCHTVYRAKLLNPSSMEAYCMKCKEKREAKDVEAVTMKNGKPAQQGKCPVCGTKMFKIGAAK
jgi:hypothetical protein